jgi:hypothetical protein
MRSMRSCFFPDLLSIVQHSSLKPEMICLSRSTVLSLMLTLRTYTITMKDERDTRRGEEEPTSKSAQGSTGDMTRANERKEGRRTGRWPCLALATQPQTHVTLPLDSTIMSSQDSDDYDKLSPAEREIRDKADRQREVEEQAGMFLISAVSFILLIYL